MLFVLTCNSLVIVSVSNKSLEMCSVFICNSVNMEKYDSHKQNFGGVSVRFKSGKGLEINFFF